MKYCHWLGTLDARQEDLWGEEAVELAVAGHSGVSILPGFVVSKAAYSDFFLNPSLKHKLVGICTDLSPKQPHLFAGASHDARAVVVKTGFAEALESQLTAFFEELELRLLHRKGKGLRLHLRALGDELLELTQVVKSGAELGRLVRHLYALTFQETLLFSRIKGGEALLHPAFSVLIQYCEKPEMSGVGQVHDPVQHDDNTIYIQASHDQRGSHNLAIEDIYRVDKKSLVLLSRELNKHWWAEDGSGKFVSPAHLGKTVATLTDEQAIRLARTLRTAQKQFTETKQFAWYYMHKQFWITRVSNYSAVLNDEQASFLPPPLLAGMSGALGVVSGPVCLIKTKKDRTKVRNGDIVVVEQLGAKDYEWLAGAGGIIAESGSQASVEALIAKQIAVPAVLGTGHALSHLKDGQVVTLDGTQGVVYAGLQPLAGDKPSHQAVLPVTGTKIYSTVSQPHRINREALQHSDGIGLLRGEFILRLLGVHPRDIINRQLEVEYADILSEGLEQALRSVYPRPVIYQLHDIASADLLGFRQRHHDRHEPNPTLGYRGTHRLLSEPELLDLEVLALANLAAKGLANFSLMLPMVRSLAEIEQMLGYLKKSPLASLPDLKLWVKCETPAMIILAEELCSLDIAGVCFDVPALSQLIVGFDKENMQVAHHLDQADRAVEQALRFAIATCREHGLPSMVVAEMDTLRPEIVQASIQAGVTALCVTPESVVETHKLVAAIEKRMVLDQLVESVS